MFVYFTLTTVFSFTTKRGALTYKAMLPLKIRRNLTFFNRAKYFDWVRTRMTQRHVIDVLIPLDDKRQVK